MEGEICQLCNVGMDNTHTPTPTQKHTHAHILHTHTHANAHKHTPRTNIHTHTLHMRKHTQTHAHTPHAYTSTTHTHTHMHALHTHTLHSHHGLSTLSQSYLVMRYISVPLLPIVHKSLTDCDQLTSSLNELALYPICELYYPIVWSTYTTIL